jgi:geranylgeranyl reductase family protein
VSDRCDAIVVGAGPAGAVAALLMARRGLDVVLVDKGRFPRDKVCGDFIGPHAVRELQELGLAETLEPGNRISAGCVFVEGREVLRNPLPTGADLPPHGYVIPRELFDERLFRAACAAGARPLEAHTFSEYQVEGAGVAVTLRGPSGERVVRARALIGADGSASLVALRMRGRPQPNVDRLIALRAYYDGVTMPEDSVDVHFGATTFPGYFWVFPTGAGRANVGIGIVPQTVSPSKRHLRDLMRDLIERDAGAISRLGRAAVATKIAGWPLSTYNGRLPIVAAPVALAGDAAGFINPINGEGIQYALASGRWVAEALSDALASGDSIRAALDGYARRVANEIGPDLALNRFIVAVASNRALNSAWIELLRAWCTRAARDPDYMAVAAGVVAGLVPARRLFEPAIRNVSLGEGFAALRRTSFAEMLRTTSAMLAAGVREPMATMQWLAHLSSTGWSSRRSMLPARLTGPGTLSL